METTGLVGRIYESIGDSLALAETFKSIAEFSDSRIAQMGVIDKGGRWVQATIVGVDPAVLQTYVERFAADDPRMLFSSRHPGQLVACHQVVGDGAAFDRSPLVNEILNIYDCRFAMAVSFPVDLGYSALLCMMRARRDGHYQGQQINRLGRFLPHIQRALNLHVRLGRLESSLTSLGALVDRLSTPIMLIDGAMMLRYANVAGQEALRQADYLTLRSGRVEARNVQQANRFEHAVAAALANGANGAPADHGGAFRLFDSEGHSIVLIVQSLRGQVNLNGMPRAEAIIFLIRGTQDAAVTSIRLQMAFSLTAAETRLAEHLLTGSGLGETAEKLKVSRETLKTQLRSLFDKTGTRRQSELVARLLSATSVSIA